MGNIKVQLASPPDRERLVASLMSASEQWGEIDQETDRLRLEIYPQRDGSPWVFDLEDVIQALKIGRDRLLGDAK